ncbi:hypothetical protein BJV77DRAFT_540601 [Russula vinacea]|nr:hypothetical protein BJV77DRAFT_540601 [Russula vinacea]
MSLSCGLGATLVQQWVRRYLKLTRHSERQYTRQNRTFLFHGIKQFQVRLVVENISLLLHAAIFLFLPARRIPFFYQRRSRAGCPCSHLFLCRILRHPHRSPRHIPTMSLPDPTNLGFLVHAHVITVVSLSPFTCSSHIQTMVEQLWKHTKRGFDNHIMDAVKDNTNLDKDAIRMTFKMCRGDSDVEAFLEAVPGYLEPNDNLNVGTRIDDIGSLLKTRKI